MSFQHNQPGSQVPWQPGPAFPSPSAAPAGGSPEQAAPIPPQVLLAAERAELGTPLTEYNRGAANSRFLTAIGGVGGLVSHLSLVLGVPVISTLIILSLLFATGPLLAKSISIGLVGLVVLLCVFFIRLMLRGTSMDGGVFRAWDCP